MIVTIDATTARQRHPQAFQACRDDLLNRIARAGQPAPQATALTWCYRWAVAISFAGRQSGGYPATLSLRLVCRHGRREASHDVTPPGGFRDAREVPVEVHHALHPTFPIADPATTPHAAQFAIIRTDGMATYLVVDGYATRDGTAYIRVIKAGAEDRGFRLLLKCAGPEMRWSGSLHPKAAERLVTTAPGTVFRYRNKPLRRLTDAEIQASVADGPYRLVGP